MMVFLCEDSFEGILSGIYDAWASEYKRDELRLEVEPLQQIEMFCNYCNVTPSQDKFNKVQKAVQTKISMKAYRQIYYCAISREADRADAIYRFLLLGFTVGRSVTDMLREPYVLRMMEIERKVTNEAHYYREFLRFSCTEQGYYYSLIEPRCNVAALVSEHFADRMPSEYFMIVDKRRRLACVHPADQAFYIRHLTEKEYQSFIDIEKKNDQTADMWKDYFQTIAIQQRKNKDCQRNHLPLRYRKYMTEFR